MLRRLCVEPKGLSLQCRRATSTAAPTPAVTTPPLVVGNRNKGVVRYPHVHWRQVDSIEYSAQAPRLPAGPLLEQLDLCSARCARTIVDELLQRTGTLFKTRTAAMTNTNFAAPVYAGDMMHIVGRVVHCGASSMGIYLQCSAASGLGGTGASRPIGEAFVTMVLVDGDGKVAREVPAVELTDPIDIARHYHYEAILKAQKKNNEDLQARRGRDVTVEEAQDELNAAKPQQVRMRDTLCRASNTFLRFRLNNHGTVFGGELLSYMEKYAVHCGRVFTQNKYVYTLGMHSVSFSSPVLPTDFIQLEAKVIYVRNTTMEVDVVIRAERDASKQHVVTNRASFILVSQDEQSRNLYISRGIDLAGASQAELHQYMEAKVRYSKRRERREELRLRLKEHGDYLK